MKKILRKWAGPGGVLVIVALVFATCYAYGEKRASDAIAEKALEEHRSALQALRQSAEGSREFQARAKAREDSLQTLVVRYKGVAGRFRLERDSFAILTRSLLPDTGEARSAFEEFARACRAEVTALEAALGACEEAALSKDARIRDLEGQLGLTRLVLDSATVGWQRAEKRANPGAFTEFIRAQKYALPEAALAAILTILALGSR